MTNTTPTQEMSVYDSWKSKSMTSNPCNELGLNETDKREIIALFEASISQLDIAKTRLQKSDRMDLGMARYARHEIEVIEEICLLAFKKKLGVSSIYD